MLVVVVFSGQQTVLYFRSHSVGIFLSFVYSASTTGQSDMFVHSPDWPVASTVQAFNSKNGQKVRQESELYYHKCILRVASERSGQLSESATIRKNKWLFMMNTNFD